MELIYLYIGNISRPLEGQGLRFGSRFWADYQATQRSLVIRKSNDEMGSLYGESIQSLDLLVGKNGTGKSSILSLLGLPQSSRLDLFPLAEKTASGESARHTWFVLYHIREDWFALEGYRLELLDLLPLAERFKPWYSAAFRYDVDRQCILGDPYFLQDIPSGNHRVPDTLFYILYEPSHQNSWYQIPYRTPDQDPPGDVFFQRIYAPHTGYAGIMRYLYRSIHHKRFSAQMDSKPGTEIHISAHQTEKSSFANAEDGDLSERRRMGSDAASQAIYGGTLPLLDPPNPSLEVIFSNKGEEKFSWLESTTLVYLEELAYACFREWGTASLSDETRRYSGEDTYEGRKSHLLSLIAAYDKTEAYLAEHIVQGIEQIPQRFFVSGTEASIAVRDMETNFLDALTQALDINQRADHDINHRYYLRLSFTGISTGEAQYLDLYASLYTAIHDSGHLPGDTCVLLLDEPDCSFHPEWSRLFIQNLTELLNTEEFRTYRYQVIISTHSPFLVSDVPKSFVHCLDRDAETGKVSIVESRHGFLSNLNDLLADSFFTGSIFGAYAENYANNLIQDIQKAETQTHGLEDRRALAQGLRKRAEVIDDPLIRNSLMRRIRRLEGGF